MELCFIAVLKYVLKNCKKIDCKKIDEMEGVYHNIACVLGYMKIVNDSSMGTGRQLTNNSSNS